MVLNPLPQHLPLPYAFGSFLEVLVGDQVMTVVVE